MKWLVYGQVGIAFAPGALITLDNVRLGDMPHLPLVEPPKMTGLHRDYSVSLIGGEPQFHTNGWYAAEVHAADVIEAEQLVERDVEPPLHAALSLAFGYPVVIRLHSVTNTETGETFARSNVVSTLPTRDLAVTPDSVIDAYAAVRGSKTEQAVLGHLKRAHDLRLSGTFGDSRVSLEAELLELAKAIEAMSRSRRFKDNHADPVDRDAARRQIIDSLQTTIEQAATGSAVQAVKRAGDALKRLDTAFGSQQVERMSHALGLDDDWRNVADMLGKVRNKTLAHSGPGLSERELRTLLDGSFGGAAWWAALECFAAYCGSRSLLRPFREEPPATGVQT